MLERKFTQETATITCPLCRKQGFVSFYSGAMIGGSLKIVKLRCLKCDFLVRLNDDELKSCDEDNLKILLQKFKETKIPPISPCWLCGNEAWPSFNFSASTIECPNCSVSVSHRNLEKAIETWNRLMARSE